MWQRQVLLFDIPFRETCTRVSFTHQRMAFPPFLSHDLCTDDAMTDIGFCAEALDTWGVTTEDADVVKHSGFLKEFLIEFQFWMSFRYLQTTVGHLTAMY